MKRFLHKRLHKWLHHRTGRICIEEIDSKLDLTWEIMWQGTNDYFVFNGTVLGIASVVSEMNKAFHEPPDELWVILPGDNRTRIL